MIIKWKDYIHYLQPCAWYPINAPGMVMGLEEALCVATPEAYSDRVLMSHTTQHMSPKLGHYIILTVPTLSTFPELSLASDN